MEWFRLYSEARNDAKLRTLSDAQHRVWFNLLCYAAGQKHERGSIRDFDMELLAIEVASGDTDLLIDTLQKLSRLRIVKSTQGSEVTFLQFEARQYDKPSDRPAEVKKRVQAHREKQAQEGETQEPETPKNAPKRDVTLGNAHTQNRGEEIRTEQRIQDPPNPPEDKTPQEEAQESAASGTAGHVSSGDVPVGNASALFIDAFKVANEGRSPDILPKHHKALKAMRERIGPVRYTDAIAGFFADPWAQSQGFGVGTFTNQDAERWANAKPPGPARASPVPSGQSAAQVAAAKETARIQAIIDNNKKATGHGTEMAVQEGATG